MPSFWEWLHSLVGAKPVKKLVKWRPFKHPDLAYWRREAGEARQKHKMAKGETHRTEVAIAENYRLLTEGYGLTAEEIRAIADEGKRETHRFGTGGLLGLTGKIVFDGEKSREAVKRFDESKRQELFGLVEGLKLGQKNLPNNRMAEQVARVSRINAINRRRALRKKPPL